MTKRGLRRVALWGTSAIALAVYLGCSGGDVDDPIPETLDVRILNSFGQLMVGDSAAHFVTLTVSDPDFDWFAPGTGTLRYMKKVGSLERCLLFRPRLGGAGAADPVVLTGLALHVTSNGMPDPRRVTYAMCNFDETELETAIENLYEHHFTALSNTTANRAAAAADFVTGVSGRVLDVYLNSQTAGDTNSILGPTVGGRIQLAAYAGSSLTPAIFLNPAPYLAPFFQKSFSPVAAQYHWQEATIEDLVAENATAPDFSTKVDYPLARDVSATETLAGLARFRIKLEDRDLAHFNGPTIVPFSVDYKLSKVTRAGAAITARDLRGNGRWRLEQLQRSNARTIGRAVYDHVRSNIPANDLWMWVPPGARFPTAVDGSARNLAVTPLSLTFDLAAQHAGSPVYPSGEYELEVKITDPFNAAAPNPASTFRAYFNIATGLVVRILGPKLRFVSRDSLPGAPITISYDTVGIAAVDEVRWRIRNAATAIVASGTISTSVTANSFTWDGRNAGVVVPNGNYTVVVEARHGASIVGTSAPLPLVIYTLAFRANAGKTKPPNPPHMVVFTNGAAGTIDFSFAPMPAAGGSLVLNVFGGAPNSALFSNAGLTTPVGPLPRTFSLTSASLPSLFVKSLAYSGTTDYQLGLQAVLGSNLLVIPLQVALGTVDLDVDTNMDGSINAADDPIEMRNRSIIIDVNNDDNDGAAGNDILDATTNAADKAQLTQAILRRIAVMPSAGRIALSVPERSRIRLFDDADVARIGPVAGGPNSALWNVPPAGLAAADLTYRAECVNYSTGSGLVVTMSVLDASGAVRGKDEVRTTLNIDRMPAPSTEPPRDYVFARHRHPAIEGYEAKLEGAKPLVSWEPTQRFTRFGNIWVGAEPVGPVNRWLQSGLLVIRDTAGVETSEIYFEFVADLAAFRAGTDPLGYKRHTKAASSWTNGKHKAEITNRATGEAQAYFNGTSWKTDTHAVFTTGTFGQITLATEPMMSVVRIPGSPGAHALASEARYKDGAGWHDAGWVVGDFTMVRVDGNGVPTNVFITAPATSATQHERHVQWNSATSFEMWDDRTF